MSSIFWMRDDQLDDEQRQAVERIPESASFLLRGPAGSGKTNILLLRAKWLTLKGQGNFRIVSFTGSLKKFLEVGCVQYGIDPAAPITQMTFFKTVLEEYSVPFELSGNFESDRNLLAGKAMSLLESRRISDNYCGALLVDEAQDYTDTELLVFRGLTKRLVLTADSRQSIYKLTHTTGLLEKLVDEKVVTLRYHYRSGLALCKVADAILTDSVAYPRIQGECHYPEGDLPSSVYRVSCGSLDEQFEQIAKNVKTQLALYSEGRIGVLFPKREQVEGFKQYLAFSSLGLNIDRIWVDTLHAAKGWEFRAVHIGAGEHIYKMGAVQKRLIYTGILRGRTSAHLYYSGHLPGYLDEALAVLEPPRPDPEFSKLF